MKGEVQLLGLAQGWPFQERKGSAFYHLFRNLVQSNAMTEIVDFQMPALLRKAFLASNFSTNRERWKLKDQIDVRRYHFASKLAEKSLRDVNADFNSVIQIGSDYLVKHPNEKSFKDIPFFSFHDNNFMSFSKSLPPGVLDNKRLKCAYDFESKVYAGLNGIFTMSRTLRDSFIRDFGIPEEKVVYAGFGSPFPPQDVSNKDYGSGNILFIASHSLEAKGGRDLLQAFREARKVLPKISLTLVGRDWGIREPGVECVGFLNKKNPDDMRRYQRFLREASLFIMPSYKEAFGEVFVEAMSQGLPCIGTKNGVMPELIEGNSAGCVITPGDVQDLTRHICELMSSPSELKRLGCNGIEAVEREYQWPRVTARILAHVQKFV